jgi:hypothetical protein
MTKSKRLKTHRSAKNATKGKQGLRQLPVGDDEPWTIARRVRRKEALPPPSPLLYWKDEARTIACGFFLILFEFL